MRGYFIDSRIAINRRDLGFDILYHKFRKTCEGNLFFVRCIASFDLFCGKKFTESDKYLISKAVNRSMRVSPYVCSMVL